MGDTMRVVVSYKKPFLKAMGKSEMVISQTGAATEIYDHSNYSKNEFALMGFINQNLRKYSKEERKSEIIKYLCRYIGEEAIDYHKKCWFLDTNTSVEDSKNNLLYPHFGNIIFRKSYMNGKLHFSGTETSESFGRKMEGAVVSGIEIAKRLQ